MKSKAPAKMPVFPFRHRYYKLDRGARGEEFTTIRGKAQLKRLKVGQIVQVETPGEGRDTVTWPALITALESKCVCQMSLEFLKADAEYPGCTISTHQHFVNLLNSFRAPLWTQVTLESELTVITLQKVPADGKVWFYGLPVRPDGTVVGDKT